MRWLLLLALLLVSTSVFPQDIHRVDDISPDVPPIEAIPPGPDKITPLRKGQLAPHDGQLFDVSTAIRWGNWLQQYKYRLVWDVEKEQQLCRAETTYRDRALEIEEERAAEVEDDMTARLLRSEKARLAAEEEARNPPWYSTWTFGTVTGVVVTAVIFGVAVAAIDATGQ